MGDGSMVEVGSVVRVALIAGFLRIGHGHPIHHPAARTAVQGAGEHPPGGKETTPVRQRWAADTGVVIVGMQDYSLSALTRRSMSSSTVPDFGSSRSASRSDSSALVRPSYGSRASFLACLAAARSAALACLLLLLLGLLGQLGLLVGDVLGLLGLLDGQVGDRVGLVLDDAGDLLGLLPHRAGQRGDESRPTGSPGRG